MVQCCGCFFYCLFDDVWNVDVYLMDEVVVWLWEWVVVVCYVCCVLGCFCEWVLYFVEFVVVGLYVEDVVVVFV